MKPSIGRIVHIVNPWTLPLASPTEPNHIAAMVTRVWSDTCINVRVFYDGPEDAPEGADERLTSICYDDQAEPDRGTWHWPEKV